MRMISPLNSGAVFLLPDSETAAKKNPKQASGQVLEGNSRYNLDM